MSWPHDELWSGNGFAKLQHLAVDGRYLENISDYDGNYAFLLSELPAMKTLTLVSHGSSPRDACQTGFFDPATPHLVDTMNNTRLEHSYTLLRDYFCEMEVRKNEITDAERVKQMFDMVKARLENIEISIKLCMRGDSLCCDSEGFHL